MFLLTKGLFRRRLTHQDLYEIAGRLTRISDIRTLALKLGVKEYKVDTIFCNKNNDITEAAYEILKEWRKGQPDTVTAYITLKDALTHPDVNLHQVAQEALNIQFGKQCEVFNMLCDILFKTWIFCLPDNWFTWVIRRLLPFSLHSNILKILYMSLSWFNFTIQWTEFQVVLIICGCLVVGLIAANNIE